ncbi:MAG: alanine--tRNA ligase [Candidatus Omnitrophota bacterium]
MNSDALRQKFLDFFKSKEHTIIPSSSLVPEDDPTVLFTSAGMNQFKDNFLGRVKTLKRAASCQKCLRTGDLDNVGRTAGHHSFFEMLGNFSFGDYFKKEAISWAWEFLTEVLRIEKEKLWCSVYKDDNESYEIWEKIIKMPRERIIRLGEKENFWPSNAPKDGPNGPCGPCSEIFFDQGKSIGCGREDCSPACDCARFVEVWNLVFTQFDRKDGGLLEPLPSKNIDTGMGLERLARAMQGVLTNFETDLFSELTGFINTVAAVKDIASSRAIADHLRAVVFAVCDGVIPSNESRGYVIRMLIRRGANLGTKLGIEGPFLYRMVPIVSKLMHTPYPELETRRENIADMILAEEKKYKETLKNASFILKQEIGLLKEKQIKELSKELAFKLYDTYGLPIETIEEIAGKSSLKVDKEGFNDLLEKQKDASRKSSGMSQVIFAQTASALIKSLNIKTEFTGYGVYEDVAQVKAIIKDEKSTDELSSGEKGYIITDKSPCYGESGGQIGDTGILEKNNTKCNVLNTRVVEDTIVHFIEARGCSIKVGDAVSLKIDTKRRLNIARHHSVTHLLQAALREVLGPHVEQSGSLVSDEFLRFDFTHFKDLDAREINRIEDVVNSYIQRALAVSTEIMETTEARTQGAMALFGEKYGKYVRVVSMGTVSKELCGGTHVKSTGEIGLFKIVSEGSVQANIRRIEAVTGESAIKKVRESEDILNRVAEVLKTPRSEVIKQVEKILKSQKELQKKLDVLSIHDAKDTAEELLEKAKEFKGIKVVIGKFNEASIDFLRKISDIIKDKEKKSVIVLASATQSKAIFIVSIGKDLLKAGFDAVLIAKAMAELIGGSGGGRADLAQAGGKDITKIDEALSAAQKIVKNLIT